MGCAHDKSAPIAVERVSAEGPRSKYTWGEVVAQRTSGFVYAARDAATGDDVEIKVINLCGGGVKLRAAEAASVRREVAILRALQRSPYIVRCLGFVTDESCAYISMEKSDDALPLFLERTTDLTEVSIKPIFLDMLSAVCACHAADIVHRDVRPDNFVTMVRLGEPLGFITKLCDFGLATRLSKHDVATLGEVVGSSPFQAPEMLDGSGYGAKVDTWAIGVIAYSLLFGSWPNGSAEGAAPRRELSFRGGAADISEPCAAWTAALLRRNPFERYSADRAFQSCAAGQWEANGRLRPALPAPAAKTRAGATTSEASTAATATSTTSPS